MRRKPKLDTSHKGIVAALEAAGASVQSLASLGGGVCDVLACKAGNVYFFECKTPKATKHKKTEADQKTWAQKMGITVYVVSTPEEAIQVLTRT
jgi:Holliday junction resolvase